MLVVSASIPFCVCYEHASTMFITFGSHENVQTVQLLSHGTVFHQAAGVPPMHSSGAEIAETFMCC